MILPVLGGILGFGILVIVLVELQILPDFIVTLYGGCIDFMNSIRVFMAVPKQSNIKEKNKYSNNKRENDSDSQIDWLYEL